MIGGRLPSIFELPLSRHLERLFDRTSVESMAATAPAPAASPPTGGRGPWLQTEDRMLLGAMASFTGHICWEELSKQIPGRSAKQCRERWQFRLHPDVNKASFEAWEDDLIIWERVTHGNYWTHIASRLPGRTSCAVKNRWYTVLMNRRPNEVPKKTKILVVPENPFYMEAVRLRDREELWRRT